MIAAVYNCIFLPYEQAFVEQEECATGQTVWWYITVFTDFLFFLDIIFNFRTTVTNTQTGDELVKDKDIMWNYLKGLFLFDLIATVPFYEMACALFTGNNIS